MADIVYLDVTRLAGKIDELKAIKTALESDIKIPHLPFGTQSVLESKGSSLDKMRVVNDEFKAGVDKFTLLVDATIRYLEQINGTFVEADSQMI